MLLILVLVFKGYFALKCTKFDNDSIEIYATPNESIIIHYDDIFKIQDYTKVEIVDLYQVITEIKPIQLLQEQEYDSSELISLVTLKQDFTEEWQNKFAALKKNGIQYEIELSIYFYSRMPNFNKKSSKITADICFDLAFYSPNLIGVDCMLVEQIDGIKNIFYIWDIQQEIFTSEENPNPIGYTEAIKRKLESSNQKIYRALLYDSKFPQFDSILEVFAQNGSIIHSLNSTILQNLISKDYQLQIIDFLVSRIDKVALLNLNGDILIINYDMVEENWIILQKFSHAGATAFDFDFQTNSYAVVLNETIIYQSATNLYIYNLNLTANQIKITKDHILVHYQKSRIYSFNFELQLIEQIDFQQKFTALITDYTQNDLLVVQQSKLQRYQLNLLHSFQFFSNVVHKDRLFSKIIQNLPNKNICILEIYHTTVDHNNEEIYISDVSESLIQQYLATYPLEQHLQINSLKFYGPNIELYFEEIKNEKLHLKITAQKLKTIQLEKKILKETPNFMKIATSENRNFIIKQYNKTSTFIQICAVDYSTCIEEDVTYGIFELNQATSPVWTGQNGVYFGDGYDNFIYIHFFYEHRKFNTFGCAFNDPVKSVVSNGELMGVLTGDFIYYFYNNDIIFKLTPETFGELGIIDWSPNQLMANSKSQDFFIINKNSTQLVIMQCTLADYRITNILDFQEKQIEKILIFEHVFAIQFQNEIQFYNNEQETNIFKFKSFPIFDQNTIIDYSQEGFVYIQTNDDILVYNIRKININSLYFAITVKQNSIISASQNFLLLNETYLVYFYDDIQILSQIITGDINFVQNVTLKTKIENQKQTIYIISPLYIYNSHTSLFFNQEAQNFIHTFDKKKQENFWQSISNEWIKGTIIDINISCSECGQEIQLTKYLQKQDQIIRSTLDFKDINKNYVMLLFTDGFEILEKKNYSSYAKYQFSKQNQCNQIMYISFNRFIFKCINVDNKLNLLSWQKQELNYEEDEDSYFVNEDFIKIDIFDKKILVVIEKQQIEFMDCGVENFTFSQCKQIQKQQIREQYLAINKAAQNIQLFSFENQLAITTFDTEKFNIINKDFIDFQQIVEEAGYKYQQSILIQMLILNNLESQIEGSQQYLFIMKNGIHYSISVKQNDQNISSTISNVLLGYGDWEAVGAISSFNWTAIEYKKNDESVVIVYNINQKKVITGLGGIIYNQTYKTIKYNFISEYNNSEQIDLLITDNDDGEKLKIFSLNEQLKLLIDGKIETQQVVFTITNNFDKIEQSIKFEITYNYYKFWGIWLLVAIIVICCLIAVFWWRKRKAERKDKKVQLLE